MGRYGEIWGDAGEMQTWLGADEDEEGLQQHDQVEQPPAEPRRAAQEGAPILSGREDAAHHAVERDVEEDRDEEEGVDGEGELVEGVRPHGLLEIRRRCVGDRGEIFGRYRGVRGEISLISE